MNPEPNWCVQCDEPYAGAWGRGWCPDCEHEEAFGALTAGAWEHRNDVDVSELLATLQASVARARAAVRR